MRDTMPGYIRVCVSLGILSHLLLAAGAVECSDKEMLLEPVPRKVAQPSDCLMECTGMTYVNKMQLQDHRNIRLKDSAEGVPGEYCWPTELKCNIGESFEHAYVVLPVDLSAAGYERLEVKVTGPTATSLTLHNSPSTVADSCGLRYDATEHFAAPTKGTSFCVQVVAEEDALGDRHLKCPPYLVTFWQRNPNQSSQQGGG